MTFFSQVAVLESSGAATGSPVAAGPVADVVAQQRNGGRVRAWALAWDSTVFALDEATVARGVKGGKTRLLGDDVSPLTSAAGVQLQLQVTPCSSSPDHPSEMISVR